MPEYEMWKQNTNTTGWDIKYYKGLGTSTREEAKEYFADIEEHRKTFVWAGKFAWLLHLVAHSKQQPVDSHRYHACMTSSNRCMPFAYPVANVIIQEFCMQSCCCRHASSMGVSASLHDAPDAAAFLKHWLHIIFWSSAKHLDC